MNCLSPDSLLGAYVCVRFSSTYIVFSNKMLGAGLQDKTLEQAWSPDMAGRVHLYSLKQYDNVISCAHLCLWVVPFVEPQAVSYFDLPPRRKRRNTREWFVLTEATPGPLYSIMT